MGMSLVLHNPKFWQMKTLNGWCRLIDYVGELYRGTKQTGSEVTAICCWEPQKNITDCRLLLCTFPWRRAPCPICRVLVPLLVVIATDRTWHCCIICSVFLFLVLTLLMGYFLLMLSLCGCSSWQRQWQLTKEYGLTKSSHAKSSHIYLFVLFGCSLAVTNFALMLFFL